MDGGDKEGAQNDGEGGEPLLGGCVLSAAVDLLPEGEVVVDAAVAGEVEGDARDVVEHDVGDLQERSPRQQSELGADDGIRRFAIIPRREATRRGEGEARTYCEVAQVRGGPGEVLVEAGQDVEENLPDEDEHDVDEPRALVVDPLGVDVRESAPVQHVVVVLGDFRHAHDGRGPPS